MTNDATAKPQPDTLLGLGSSDGLGPLMAPHDPPVFGYTSADMRAYAAREVAAERERCAKLCIERAQLSWAAADQPHVPEVKMQHESVAAAMEELARELRA